ncbi:hypothetical protein ABZ468_56025, partial [Streptomyces sp. NPDC005708]
LNEPQGFVRGRERLPPTHLPTKTRAIDSPHAAAETHGDPFHPYDGCAAPVAAPVDALLFESAPAASGRDPRQTAPAEMDQ